MGNKRMKALLVNQGCTDNIGDKLINEVLSTILSQKYDVDNSNLETYIKEKNIKDEIKNKKNSKKNIGILRAIRHFPFFILKKILTKYNYDKLRVYLDINRICKNKEYDLVLIGGGELLKTNHSFIACLDAWTRYFSKNKNTRLVLYGVSSDQNFTKKEINKLECIFNRLHYINVRDKETKAFIDNKFKLNVGECPDCVFAYSSLFDKKVNKNGTVSVSIFDYNSWNFLERFSNINEYFDYWKQIIDNEVGKNYERVRFSYTTSEDAIMTEKFIDYYSNLFNKNLNKISNSNQDEIIKDIINADTIITGRMHAMIIGKQYDVKIVPFIFKKKIEYFANKWENFDFDKKDISSKIEKELSLACNTDIKIKLVNKE